MNNFIKVALLILLGAAGGYAYFFFIGCNAANACPITSSPVSSTIYGSLIGGAVSLNFVSRKRTGDNK
jgi:hypothetical protein